MDNRQSEETDLINGCSKNPDFGRRSNKRTHTSPVLAQIVGNSLLLVHRARKHVAVEEKCELEERRDGATTRREGCKEA
jgi:hypothetical protein